MIKELKGTRQKQGLEVKWDIEARYQPEQHIARGWIAEKDNVLFLRQIYELRCFGFDGKKFSKVGGV